MRVDQSRQPSSKVRAKNMRARRELLEAAKEAVTVFEAMGHKDIVCAIDLRAAIAKAEATNGN